MSLSNLPPSEIIAIAVLLLIVVGVVAFLLRRRRSENLRTRFGPEYDRALSEGGDRTRVEAKLAERLDRVKSYHLRPLTEADRVNYRDAWNRVQAQFVDDPAGAVSQADNLLAQVMSARGYPVSDFEQRAADISVDHPQVVQNYRTAHQIAVRHSRGEAGTEDLRNAMIHYRALFEDLIAEPAAAAPSDRVARDVRSANERRSSAA